MIGLDAVSSPVALSAGLRVVKASGYQVSVEGLISTGSIYSASNAGLVNAGRDNGVCTCEDGRTKHMTRCWQIRQHLIRFSDQTQEP